MRGDMNIHRTGLGDDERLVVSPRRARHMLDCGNTRLYELLKNKELESYVDGRSRKIIVASIHRYIAQRLKEAESTAASAPVAPAARRGRPAKIRSGESAAP
jgi:hypothetical protein